MAGAIGPRSEIPFSSFPRVHQKRKDNLEYATCAFYKFGESVSTAVDRRTGILCGYRISGSAGGLIPSEIVRPIAPVSLAKVEP